MTKTEAKALLEYLEQRLNYVKHHTSVERDSVCRYLTKADPKDIVEPSRAHYLTTYVSMIRNVQEDLCLQREIDKLRAALGK